MQVEVSFPADGQPFEVVQAREGLLDDVAELAQALDVRGALAGDHRQDPAPVQLTPVGVAVVALVTEEGVRTPARSTWLPATGGTPSTRARVCVTSLTLAAVVMTLNGVPLTSQIRWCLLPVFLRSTGDGPVASPPFRADVGGIHAGPGPVQCVGRVQLGEQYAVQLVEGAGLVPPPASAPAGLPRAEPQLQRQQLPAHVVVENVQDALQA